MSIKLLIAGLLILLMAGQGMALSCGDALNSDGTIYTLTSNVSSGGNCFTITASNITLDGAGYEINYSINATGYGISASTYNNITIKNLLLSSSNVSNGNSSGIFFSNITNGNITNNTITTANASDNHGVYFESNTSSVNVSGNTITTYGVWSKGINIKTNCFNNSILSNTITTSGGTNAYGIITENAGTYNNISNNIITTSGTMGLGIVSHVSNYDIITNNTIVTTGQGASGIYLSENTLMDNYHVVTGNRVNVSGGGSTYGMYFYNAGKYINASGNTINSSTTNAIRLTNSSFETLDSNIIYSTNISGHGIYQETGANNTFNSNTITTSGNTSYGIFLTTSSVNDTVSNNVISTSGLSSHAMKVDLSSNSNQFSSNRFTTTGVTANGIVLATNNNTFTNDIITTTDANAYGFQITGANDNNITNLTISSVGIGAYPLATAFRNRFVGGSIISSSSYDYFLASPSNNTFQNTNFSAARKVYFSNAATFFNYSNVSNSNIWILTNMSAVSYLNKRSAFSSFTQNNISWQDISSVSGTRGYYTVSGLYPNVNYTVSNNTVPEYHISDSSGTISFNLTLSTNNIKVTTNYRSKQNPFIAVEVAAMATAATIALYTIYRRRGRGGRIYGFMPFL